MQQPVGHEKDKYAVGRRSVPRSSFLSSPPALARYRNGGDGYFVSTAALEALWWTLGSLRVVREALAGVVWLI
ncbi:hypothetical protein IMZ48_19005 [Candidatus Bathyarchaeota archaeon]|nr:hypothetical protein [Candidatus Bathyarchaeota archaeon]